MAETSNLGSDKYDALILCECISYYTVVLLMCVVVIDGKPSAQFEFGWH